MMVGRNDKFLIVGDRFTGMNSGECLHYIDFKED
jgi:hypothetical protein